MKTSRRNFLGFLAVAPSAAKAHADKVMGEAGFSAFGEVPVGVGLSPSPVSDACTSMDLADEWRNKRRKAFTDLFKRFLGGEKLPAFKMQEIKERAYNFNGLDPDISAMVSVSPARKIQMQRNRNIQVLTDRAINRLNTTMDRDDFCQKHNIDWYD